MTEASRFVWTNPITMDSALILERGNFGSFSAFSTLNRRGLIYSNATNRRRLRTGSFHHHCRSTWPPSRVTLLKLSANPKNKFLPCWYRSFPHPPRRPLPPFFPSNGYLRVVEIPFLIHSHSSSVSPQLSNKRTRRQEKGKRNTQKTKKTDSERFINKKNGSLPIKYLPEKYINNKKDL